MAQSARRALSPAERAQLADLVRACRRVDVDAYLLRLGLSGVDISDVEAFMDTTIREADEPVQAYWLDEPCDCRRPHAPGDHAPAHTLN